MKFWINLALVVSTSYVVIWYIFTPPNNQCQMTFMMEPPKFIPVPVDGSTTGHSTLSYPELKVDGPINTKEKYKLYMYSEFGFPQPSNVQRDLKDSMPVLFVPGNAGSYQQVRSLASTCIRRQLQSLDAFKFIFYTIDFQGQFSGVSGHLIEQQILFVHKSLNQITKMHPTETGGVIVIGHSVGGFISKALVTVPDFNLNTVPLLISLASPLTSPYLIFDEKMRKLYAQTNQFWSGTGRSKTQNIAISISGGRSDRLVPMHLSMDPHFDLALTTSAIKDVWLATDHVCITWCRELVHKLSHLLSSLMDKKQTRLIADKKTLNSILLKELLTDYDLNDHGNSSVMQKEWRISKSHQVVTLEDYYSVSRSELSDSVIVIKIEQPGPLLISIDYIDSLKDHSVSGCRTLEFSDGRAVCSSRVNLMPLKSPIPTRRFEPKKVIIEIRKNDLADINFIVFDFVQNFADRNENKVPELVTIQRLQEPEENSLYIPSLMEFILKKMLFIDSYTYPIKSKKVSFTRTKYELLNLKHNTQLFSLAFQSQNCKVIGAHKSSTTILLSQGNHVKESFHPTLRGKETMTAAIKLSPVPSILIERSPPSNKTHLQFFIDGTCENSLQILVDPLDLFVDVIHRNLSTVIAYSTFLTYKTFVHATTNIKHQVSSSSMIHQAIHHIMAMVGFSFLYSVSSIVQIGDVSEPFLRQDLSLQDELMSIILIWALSSGLFSFSTYLVERVMDLAIILNNVQLLLRQKVSAHKARTEEFPTNGSNRAGLTNPKNDSVSIDLDWILLGLGAAGGLIFSTGLISVFMLFILIKSELHLNNIHFRKAKPESTEPNHHINPDSEREKLLYRTAHNLLISIAVLNALMLLANTPAALLVINGNRLSSIGSILKPMLSDMNFMATLISLLLVKLIAESIESHVLASDCSNEKMTKKPKDTNAGNQIQKLVRSICTTEKLHALALAPILMIDKNMCSINFTFLLLMIWLKSQLPDKSSGRKGNHCSTRITTSTESSAGSKKS